MSAFYNNTKGMRGIALITLILTFNSLTGLNAWALGMLERQKELSPDLMDIIDGSLVIGGTAGISAINSSECANQNCNCKNSIPTSNLTYEQYWETTAMYDQVDLSIPLKGDLAINLVRSYFGRRAQVNPDEYKNILGSRFWAMNIDQILYTDYPNYDKVVLDNGDMRLVFFELGAGETTKYVSVSTSGNYWTMDQVVSGFPAITKFQIRKEDGSLLLFDENGRLNFEFDHSGNFLEYQRNSEYRTTKIIGSDNSTSVTLQYDLEENGYVLTKVNAPNHLSIIYEYERDFDDADLVYNNLTKVTWKDRSSNTELRSESYVNSTKTGSNNVQPMTKVFKNGQVYRTMINDGEKITAYKNSSGQTKLNGSADGIIGTTYKTFSPVKQLSKVVEMSPAHDPANTTEYFEDETSVYSQVHYDSTSGADIRNVRSKVDKRGNIVFKADYNFLSLSRNYTTFRSLKNMTKQSDVFNNITTILYETACNRPTKITHPDGNITELYYNSGNLTKSILKTNGGTVLHKEQYDLNGNGEVLTKRIDPDGLNYTSSYQYNNRGQVTKVSDGCGCQSGSRDIYYDDLGRVTKLDAGAAGNAVEFYPDKLGNQTKVKSPIKDPNSPTWIESAMSYDKEGNLTKLVDPLGRISYNYFDTDFRLTKSQNALNGTIVYQYDYWGNLTSLRDPNSNETVYEYDALERLTKEADASNQSTTFQYDANDNLTRTVNPNAVATTFAYNNGDMLTKIDRAGSEVDAVYQFDLTKGQLTKIVESGTGADTIIFGYDTSGQLNRESPSVNVYGEGGQIRYTYNATGELAQLQIDPDEENHNSYYYDATGQLEELYSDFFSSNFYYYDADLRITKTAGGYNEVVHEYDAGGRLTKLNNKADGNDYIQSYGYDDAGNRTKTTLGGQWSGTATYSYDDLYQLTREVRAGTANNYDYKYWYDPAGNRTKQDKGGTVTEYSHNAANQLVYTQNGSGDELSYEYDANGNLTKRAEGKFRYFAPFMHFIADEENKTEYFWDSRNLMTKVTVTASGTPTNYTFAYDALGRRNSMVSGGVTKYYAYQGLNVLWEKNASTGYYTYHVNDPRAVGGRLWSLSDEDGLAKQYQYDALGNLLFTTDSSGAVDEQFVQDAFGNVIGGTASGIHLTGKEYFPEFGLYYFNARWYDPEIGRFVSKDSIRAINDYIYCLNNPINLIDNDGHSPAWLIAGGVGAVAGAALGIMTIPNWCDTNSELACFEGCMTVGGAVLGIGSTAIPYIAPILVKQGVRNSIATGAQIAWGGSGVATGLATRFKLCENICDNPCPLSFSTSECQNQCAHLINGPASVYHSCYRGCMNANPGQDSY